MRGAELGITSLKKLMAGVMAVITLTLAMPVEAVAIAVLNEGMDHEVGLTSQEIDYHTDMAYSDVINGGAEACEAPLAEEELPCWREALNFAWESGVSTAAIGGIIAGLGTCGAGGIGGCVLAGLGISKMPDVADDWVNAVVALIDCLEAAFA